MYKVLITIESKEKTVDTYKTTFGIRSIKHDKEQGLFLNGTPIFAKGVCLHHDAGLVGPAVPKGVWKRRLELLKGAVIIKAKSAKLESNLVMIETK